MSREPLETIWKYWINERNKTMKNPEQLKGAIRNIAREKNLHAQEILQFFFFERLLDRLSQSNYKKNFILKGGLLISSMIGISERTTMDMDTTVQGISMEKESIERVIKEIISTDVSDGISFIFSKMEAIREDDEYENYRIHLTAEYGKIKNPIKIDITTGDHVTPDAVEYGFHSLFDEKIIPVNAYQLETILAEKYETILRRGIGNTRARDFYSQAAICRLAFIRIQCLFRMLIEHLRLQSPCISFHSSPAPIASAIHARSRYPFQEDPPEKWAAPPYKKLSSPSSHADRASFDQMALRHLPALSLNVSHMLVAHYSQKTPPYTDHGTSRYAPSAYETA